MNLRRLLAPALLGGAAAVLLAPPRLLAPTEVEPNDDPGAGDYAGALAFPAAPAVLSIDGSLADPADVDAFRLDVEAPGSAIAVLSGFTGAMQLQAIHAPGAPGDGVSPEYPYALRFVAGYALLAEEDDRLNVVGVHSSTGEDAAPYLLRVASPGPRAARSAITCVFRERSGGDSLKARLEYDPAVALGPGTTGDVEFRVRDFVATVPASAFRSNGPGTRFTYRGPGPGLRKVSWNTRKGIVAFTASGLDFGAPPAEGSLPCIALSSRGGVADAPAGVVRAGRASTKISGRRK